MERKNTSARRYILLAAEELTPEWSRSFQVPGEFINLLSGERRK
jgi:hypothetical protein